MGGRLDIIKYMGKIRSRREQEGGRKYKMNKIMLYAHINVPEGTSPLCIYVESTNQG